jgi:hypothetical protein
MVNYSEHTIIETKLRFNRKFQNANVDQSKGDINHQVIKMGRNLQSDFPHMYYVDPAGFIVLARTRHDMTLHVEDLRVPRRKTHVAFVFRVSYTH